MQTKTKLITFLRQIEIPTTPGELASATLVAQLTLLALLVLLLVSLWPRAASATLVEAFDRAFILEAANA